MPRSINKTFLLGHLGKDAETRYTPNGAACVSFSIATTRKWKDKSGEWKEEVSWHNIVSWQSENVAQYLTKGKAVHVQGRLQTRSYEDRDGDKRYVTEVVAEDIILLGGGESAACNNSQGRCNSANTGDNEDVPF